MLAAEPSKSAVWQPWPDMLARSLFYFALLSQIFIAWKFWHLTWDDSAITLGFAQTFAHTGRIEATPGSGVVEGYSTTLWMLLMAAIARAGASSQELLVSAKLGSLFLNCACIVMLRSWFRRWMPDALSLLAAGVFGSSFTFYETINGMETPLLLVELVGMLLLTGSTKRAGRIVYLVLGCCVVLTRWESAWLLIPFVLLERPFRRAFASSATWLAMFAGSSLWRRLYFGSYLPNTILAKQSAPYFNTGPHGVFVHHLRQAELIVKVGGPLVLIVLAYLIWERVPVSRIVEAWRCSSEAKLATVMVAFNVVLTIAIGFNWGPPLRSFYPAWPLLVGLILFPLSLVTVRPGLSKGLCYVTAFVCVFGLTRFVFSIADMRFAKGPSYMPGTTIDAVKNTSDVLKKVQSATGKEDGFVYPW